jgi:ferredoxin
VPETTSHRELHVDRDLCMGSGQCVYYAPNTFDQDDDSISVVTNPQGDPEEVIETAITACPTRALSWTPPAEA